MKSKFLYIPLLSIGLVACESHMHNPPPPPPPPPTEQHTMNPSATDMRMDSESSRRMSPNEQIHFNEGQSGSVNRDADNTGRNIRDRNPGTLTSFDQSEKETDRTISQNIRRALMNDPTLSTNAKNIKIITIDNIVTLRGPVNTAQEKAIIERIISQIAGIERLDDQLEVLQQANR
ncbi:MAG: hydrogenase [Parachlamydia sp.]|nr:MAG: hydrogenase [Parachlamydia sp.]